MNWCLHGEWLIPVQILSIRSDLIINLSKKLKMLNQNVKKKRKPAEESVWIIVPVFGLTRRYACCHVNISCC